jgi:GAF domain-containing protein
MDDSRSRRCDRAQRRPPHSRTGEAMRFLLRGEEQFIQSISAHAPLPELLNRICSALGWAIGNVVSLISLRDDGATDLAAVAGNAKQFGLYSYCSAAVFAENDELLGSLEMYCCVPRGPSVEEIQMIERATCLAAIAIMLDNDANHHRNWGTRGDRFVGGRELGWSVSLN